MMGAPVPRSAVVCPGQTGSIYCPALKLLKITSAFYGKQQGQDCTGKIISDNTPTCYARDTVTTVKDMCDGQQSCDLFSEPELYGRTLCSATAQKYLQVNYMCEGHSDLEEQLAKHKEGFMKIGKCLYYIPHIYLVFFYVQYPVGNNSWIRIIRRITWKGRCFSWIITARFWRKKFLVKEGALH